MLQYAGNRDVLDRFEQPSVRLSVEADLKTVDHYDELLKSLDRPQLQILDLFLQIGSCQGHDRLSFAQNVLLFTPFKNVVCSMYWRPIDLGSAE